VTVTERVAVHTRLRPGSEAEYDAAHREVPADLVAAMREAGVLSWRIWRSDLDVFQVVECRDYGQLLAALEDLPVNQAWQARMATLQKVLHDYSATGAAATLPLVWDVEEVAP
jgi:L-rhamnose mutarotase